MGPPKALLETPQGGTNIVSGLGLYTGGINPRAVAALWMAGETSLMYDVRFHGPFVAFPQADRDAHYRLPQPAPQGAAGRWGAQYPSLWVNPERGIYGDAQVDRLWILNVDGQRLVVDASYSSASTPEDIETLTAMVEAIEIASPADR